MTNLQYAGIIANIWFVGYLSQSEKPDNKWILKYNCFFLLVLHLVLLLFS